MRPNQDNRRLHSSSTQTVPIMKGKAETFLILRTHVSAPAKIHLAGQLSAHGFGFTPSHGSLTIQGLDGQQYSYLPCPRLALNPVANCGICCDFYETDKHLPFSPLTTAPLLRLMPPCIRRSPTNKTIVSILFTQRADVAHSSRLKTTAVS